MEAAAQRQIDRLRVLQRTYELTCHRCEPVGLEPLAAALGLEQARLVKAIAWLIDRHLLALADGSVSLTATGVDFVDDLRSGAREVRFQPSDLQADPEPPRALAGNTSSGGAVVTGELALTAAILDAAASHLHEIPAADRVTAGTSIMTIRRQLASARPQTAVISIALDVLRWSADGALTETLPEDLKLALIALTRTSE